MKKKTLLIAAVISFAAVSCKKDRTCVCTTTSSYTNSNGQTTTNTGQAQTTDYKKVKKSQLGTICGNNKYSSSQTEDGETTSNTSETTCEIK